MLWVEFVVCIALIFFSGVKLAKYGDVIARRTGLGRAWVGLVLVASITSMPELINGISSVALVGSVDLAMGDVFGSCVYNLAILALMDYLNKDKPLLAGVGRGNILSAGFGMALIGIASVSVLTKGALPVVWHVSIVTTPVIVVVYLVGIRAVYHYEKLEIEKVIKKEVEGREAEEDVPGLSTAIKHYVVNSAVIIAAATFLPYVAGKLAVETGLGATFMGSVFVAMSTSLPELVVSVAAVRMGAIDMGVANMLGSNMFNILILAVDDVFYVQGSLFEHASMQNVVSGLVAMIMTAVVIIGITYPEKNKRIARVGVYSWVLLLLFIVNIVLLYLAVKA